VELNTDNKLTGLTVVFHSLECMYIFCNVIQYVRVNMLINIYPSSV